MMQIRKSEERGGANHGWLDSKHTFSFADYYDPEMMGFSVLRVINEDWIDGGTGFPAHPHRDMEIITVVMEGALEHRDTLGTHSIIQPGEVQRMTAGTGIRHSEFNHLHDKKTHLYQIWLLPDRSGHKPGYEQKSFAQDLEKKSWVLAASSDGRDGSLKIHQQADLWLGRLKSKDAGERKLDPKRKYWIQVMRGELSIDGEKVKAGDGVAISSQESVELKPAQDSEVLLFDLP